MCITQKIFTFSFYDWFFCSSFIQSDNWAVSKTSTNVTQTLALSRYRTSVLNFPFSTLIDHCSSSSPLCSSGIHQPRSLRRLSSKPKLASVSLCRTPSLPLSSNHYHHHRSDDTYTRLTLITARTQARCSRTLVQQSCVQMHNGTAVHRWATCDQWDFATCACKYIHFNVWIIYCFHCFLSGVM